MERLCERASRNGEKKESFSFSGNLKLKEGKIERVELLREIERCWRGSEQCRGKRRNPKPYINNTV